MIITRAVGLHACALTTLYTDGRRGNETEHGRILEYEEVQRKVCFDCEIRLGKSIKKILGNSVMYRDRSVIEPLQLEQMFFEVNWRPVR